MAKNAQKRRPSHIEDSHDSEGHYIDQVASDSIQYTSADNVVMAPPHADHTNQYRGELISFLFFYSIFLRIHIY